MMKHDLIVVDVVDAVEVTAGTGVVRRTGLVETVTGSVRRIPRHVLPYSLTLVVNGEPQAISDAHAEELQVFASVNQKNGIVENVGDRKAALVVLMPKGNFACINLDDPTSIPVKGPRR